MVKTKQAITLAEIMIVMAIVSIVSICMLGMYKPNDKATRRLYYNAYKTLSTSAYNVYRKLEYENRKRIDNDDPNDPPYEPVDATMRSGFARFGTVLYAEKTALCTNIADLLNTTGGGCNGNHSYTGPDTSSPDIITSNGMRFYFTDPFIVGNVIHRIVWVDLDGAQKGNNTPVWSENNLLDIVAFDIGDFGDVVPLGYPKIDSRYTQGVLITSSPNAKYISKPTTFYEAQLAAYGGNSNDFDMMSTNIEFTDNRFNKSPLKVPDETLSSFSATSFSGTTSCDSTSGIPSCTIDIVP